MLLLAAVPAIAQTTPTYDDDVKPLIQRRCLPCHSASEMRASLNLETFQGFVKGGGSGDVVKPGRPNISMLYKVIAREEGVPQMPLGGPNFRTPIFRRSATGSRAASSKTRTASPSAPPFRASPTSRVP